MYVILVQENNELHASFKERIMQRSKLVDKLVFLADPIYHDLDMSEFTVTLEYVTPISKKYTSEILTLSEELYEDKLQYLIPFDTNLTQEPGDVELQLTFTKADLDEEGKGIQYVRKTSPIFIKIVSIAAWSDIIPDSALNALDQKLLEVDSQIKELEALNEAYSSTKADSIEIDMETGTLNLTSNGTEIGNSISLNDLGNAIAEGTSDGLVEVII